LFYLYKKIKNSSNTSFLYTLIRKTYRFLRRYKKIIEKYKIENGKIHLVPQPFYYLGIKQNTDAPFAILYEPNEKASVVANIAKDTEVEVIGVKILNDEKWILIKSGLELTGWVKLFYIEPEQSNFHRAFVDILSDSD